MATLDQFITDYGTGIIGIFAGLDFVAFIIGAVQVGITLLKYKTNF